MTVGGVTVTDADSVEPPAEAVNVIVEGFDTLKVVITNETELFPAGTTTVARHCAMW